jgi:hypothetical protein
MVPVYGSSRRRDIGLLLHLDGLRFARKRRTDPVARDIGEASEDDLISGSPNSGVTIDSTLAPEAAIDDAVVLP